MLQIRLPNRWNGHASWDGFYNGLSAHTLPDLFIIPDIAQPDGIRICPSLILISSNSQNKAFIT